MMSCYSNNCVTKLAIYDAIKIVMFCVIFLQISFSEKQGSRETAVRKAVLMVDTPDPDLTKTLREAGKMKIMKNVEIFVIGVGKSK